MRGGGRTQFEPRLAFPAADEDAEEIAAPTRTFSWWDVTGGLPDDSREEDERQEERRLRDLRGRVKAARAVVARTRGLAEVLAGDWRKARLFHMKFGITEEMLRNGVPGGDATGKRLADVSCPPTNALAERGEHYQVVPPPAA